jgi:ABC exporter DevB family membrane fusion protein
MANMTRVAIVGVAVFGAGLAAGLTFADAIWPTADAAAAVPAATARPHAAGLVAAPGRVEPASEEIDIGAELAGRLADVLADEGDAVARGQVLARLDSDDARARLASAEASLAVAEAELARVVNGARSEERREVRAAVRQAEAEFEQAELEWRRRDELARDGVIPAEERDRAARALRVMRAKLDEARERADAVDGTARADERTRAEASVRLARARVQEANAVLEKTVLRAPVDGTVLRRYKEAGESVAPESKDSARVFTVADTRRLRVRVDVDETDVARVTLGQPAWVTADAYGDRRFEGTVVRVGSLLGRKNIRTDEPTERVDTRVLETLIELHPDVRLPVGLRVDAFIGARDGGVRSQ